MLQPNKDSTQNTALTNQDFLPDLCGIRTLLTVMIVAQLLAFVLVLASPASNQVGSGWTHLGLTSLFVHWVCLSSTAGLCLLRRPLAQLPPVRAAVASYTLILIISFLMSYLVVWLGSAVNVRYNPEHSLLFALRNTGIAAIVAAIFLRFVYLHHRQQLSAMAESSARVEALQARIRPHFLFNSMNSIAALIKIDPERAEQAIEDLAELFRSSMLDISRRVSLAQEIELVKRYLQIESLRLGDRLRVEWAIDSIPKQALLPPLILQPLFENAVYYGIEPLVEGGCIRMQGKRIDDLIEIVIENPAPPPAAQKRSGGNKLAIQNIRERLGYVFGKRAQLYLVEDADKVRVILTFPYRETEE